MSFCGAVASLFSKYETKKSRAEYLANWQYWRADEVREPRRHLPPRCGGHCRCPRRRRSPRSFCKRASIGRSSPSWYAGPPRSP